MFSVSEYGRIFLGKDDKSSEDGNLELCEPRFRSLMSLLEREDDEEANYSPVFTYMRPNGREQLRVQNYVGVIRLDDGTQIEVLPKIAKKLKPGAARMLLIKMLVELEESRFFEGAAADLEAHDMPLFEVILRCFLEQVTTIVKKGLARTYVAKRDNLVFLRGKLQMTEHIRRNSYNASRMYCEFGEYDADRPINRLIKGALEIVIKVAREATNQQRCRELLFWFESVPGTKDPKLDFQRMRRDRLVQHYTTSMPLCRLILERLNPLTQQGENQVVSMLFPMEKVFEAYVSAKLPSKLLQWRVSDQVRGRSLVDDHRGSTAFDLIPDLVFVQGSKKVIGDTKWKLIDENDRGHKYGISQSDIYQLFGYSKKYLGAQQNREVILIYPKSDSFQNALEPFYYAKPTEVLHVVPFDLDSETLILPDGSQLKEDSIQAAS